MGMSSASAARLSFERRGKGEPLVLIHGTGSQWQTWGPVLNLLAANRNVVAVDLPGHGRSAPAPAGTPLTAAGFARLIGIFLSEQLGIDFAHVAGNSMGGWIALEMAKLGYARSVTALCPAGLWRTRTPRYCLSSFRINYALARLLGRRGAYLATSTAVGRTLIMGQMFGRPWKIPADNAAEAVRNLAESPVFLAHLQATAPERFTGGREIEVPVTVAWGARDILLLPWQSRHQEELPPRARIATLPRCGHVPMHDDPDLVARVVLKGSASNGAADRFAPQRQETQPKGQTDTR
jgi:pimeloyl-ACP methyl ester carboxylesterase